MSEKTQKLPIDLTVRRQPVVQYQRSLIVLLYDVYKGFPRLKPNYAIYINVMELLYAKSPG